MLRASSLLLAALVALVAPYAAADPREDTAPRREASAPLEPSPELGPRSDRRRPPDPFTVDVFGRPLTLGAEYQIRTNVLGNRSLGTRSDDDEGTFRQRLTVDLRYELHPRALVYLEGRLLHLADLFGTRDETHEWRLERGEMWLELRDLGWQGLGLQVGRLNFEEKREWWWDVDLDGVRVFFERPRFRVQAAVARELGSDRLQRRFVDPDLEDVLFLFGQATWKLNDGRLRIDLFVHHQHDDSGKDRLGDVVSSEREDASDARLSWVGARASGRLKSRGLGRLDYWLDLGTVFGTENRLSFESEGSSSRVDESTRRNVRGFGTALGVTWDPRRRFWPRFTTSWSFGSGRGRRGDRGFRQTGLQDNNARFRGTRKFRYYGELLRPDLSNLHVATLGLGVPLFEASSAELLFHTFVQDRASRVLRGSRLAVRPDGRSRMIGHELDLVVGIREWRRWEVSLVGAAFRAGSAFGPSEGEIALLGRAQVSLSF